MIALLAEATAASPNPTLIFGTLTPLEAGCFVVITTLASVVGVLFTKNQNLNKKLAESAGEKAEVTSKTGEEKLTLALRLQPLAERAIEIINKHNELETARLAEESARKKMEEERRARELEELRERERSRD